MNEAASAQTLIFNNWINDNKVPVSKTLENVQA